MADGGTSPVGDPGNLSIYSIHGGANKMVELISDVSGGMDMLPCQPDNSNHGMYSGPNQAALYPVQSDLVSGSYVQVDPLHYGEGSSFDDLKRSSTMASYYGNSENMNNPGNMFNSHSLGAFQSNQQEILKANSTADSMGYIQLLSNVDSLGHESGIKKEKLDYDDLNMINSQSPDIPYPPNTCIADWNFYNPSLNLPTTSKAMNQTTSNYNAFQVPSMPLQQQQYLPGSMYETNSHMPQMLGLSNEDIHHQAKKISHEIISHGWHSENLYKTQHYPNVTADVMNRKRKSEIEKPVKTVKSRRRKSDAIDGHSKTVASILMSDNHLASSSQLGTGPRSWMENELLNSTARNMLLSSLMDNLRSTVQFESFCLSFPRSQGKEDAFRKKVLHVAGMTNEIPGVSLLSSPISEEYTTRAAKIISAFKSALLNTETSSGKHALTGDKFNNLRSDQVEEHLPHSMVWTVKMGDHLLTANWEGQFVTTVNPEQSTLSFSLFDFQPCFSADGIKCLQHSKLTKTLAEEILCNMRQFEVSRQLRFDVGLESIKQIYLFASGRDAGCGCLTLEMSRKPVDYYQRWVHCSAENKNKWKRRKSFFAPLQHRSGRFIFIGGLMSELNELVALILTSNSEIETLYEQGTMQPLRMDVPASYENGFDNYTEMNDNFLDLERSNGVDRTACRLLKNCKVLQKELVQILIQNHIIKDAKSVTIANLDDRLDTDVNRDYCESLGIGLDGSISECFRDYINYTCKSAIELCQLLAIKVNPSSFGFCDSDFDLNLVPGRDIERLTVGQLLESGCSDIVYFSFCTKQVGQLGHEKHCSKCRTCNTWRYWHCDFCNKCTDSRKVCELCGHLQDDQSRVLIKPLSVFKSQEDSGKLVMELEKQEWHASLNLPFDDVISWEFPNVPLTDNINSSMEYNSTNAMVDQLGLLNPVGFLLGQPAASASRKHRRYKESKWYGKQGDIKNTKSGIASACNLQ